MALSSSRMPLAEAGISQIVLFAKNRCAETGFLPLLNQVAPLFRASVLSGNGFHGWPHVDILRPRLRGRDQAGITVWGDRLLSNGRIVDHRLLQELWLF